MSDAALDLREQLIRIDRAQAEIHRAQAETGKFVAEQRKLISESRKLDRDYWFAPAIAIASAIGGVLGAAAFVAKLVWG